MQDCGLSTDVLQRGSKKVKLAIEVKSDILQKAAVNVTIIGCEDTTAENPRSSEKQAPTSLLSRSMRETNKGEAWL